jgi:hypothetical protein
MQVRYTETHRLPHERIPGVADGVVDLADLVMLIDNWGTDDPLYDIGPFAWGDGVGDAQDLLVLAEYMVETPPLEGVDPWR